jgi:hypothetical protein
MINICVISRGKVTYTTTTTTLREAVHFVYTNFPGAKFLDHEGAYVWAAGDNPVNIMVSK